MCSTSRNARSRRSPRCKEAQRVPPLPASPQSSTPALASPLPLSSSSSRSLPPAVAVRRIDSQPPRCTPCTVFLAPLASTLLLYRMIQHQSRARATPSQRRLPPSSTASLYSCHMYSRRDAHRRLDRRMDERVRPGRRARPPSRGDEHTRIERRSCASLTHHSSPATRTPFLPIHANRSLSLSLCSAFLVRVARTKL